MKILLKLTYILPFFAVSKYVSEKGDHMKLSSIIILSTLLTGSSFASCFSESEIKRELRNVAVQSFKAGKTTNALKKEGVSIKIGKASDAVLVSSNENCFETQVVEVTVPVRLFRQGPGMYMSKCGGSVVVRKTMNKSEGSDSYSVSNKNLLRCTR